MTVSLLLLWGCTGTDTPEDVSPLDDGWPGILLGNPQAFADAVEEDRDSWIRYHSNDLHGAQGSSGAIGTRASRDMELVEQDLAILAGQVWERAFSTWEIRSGLPPGSAIPVVAALSALDAADEARAASWLEKGSNYTDPSVATLASQLGEVGLSGVSGEGLSACISAHHKARSSRDQSLLSACPTPLVTEVTDSHTRTLYDPLIYSTLSAIYAPLEALPDEGMHGLLFSGRWSEADSLERATATLAALGLSEPGDTSQSARDFVRALDTHLDDWIRGASAQNAEGAALLEELQAVPVFRSRLLTVLAREKLRANQPQAALALAQLALDVEHSRAVGPLNPPGLFAVLATASFQTGRTREALEYLAPLAPSWPEIVGLDETLGDLVVLENLERVGDSKEN